MYPINKPVTADDIRTKTAELLAREGEWTPWETRVLNLLGEGADTILGHYMRHVWFEVEDLAGPDVETARGEVVIAAERMLSEARQEDALEALLHSAEEIDPAAVDVHGVASLLLGYAGLMVDAIIESLRRGPCAIDDNEAYRVHLTEWADVLAFRDEHLRTPAVAEALVRLEDGLRAAREAGRSRDDSAAACKELRMRNQAVRNDERIHNLVDLCNQNYNLPEGYHLRFNGMTGNQIVLSWGMPREMRAVRGRPGGGETIVLIINTIGEIHPRIVSDVARAGRLAALTLGRDAEAKAHGRNLDSMPDWSWAGPVTLVRYHRALMEQGVVTQIPPVAGPLLSGRVTIPMGDSSAVYAFNAKTLDESLTLDQEINRDLAFAVVGNPVSVLVSNPLFEGSDITIEACEVEDGATDLDIVSPLIRLQPAPPGVEQDPEQAWLGMLPDFDDEAVYGS